MNCEFCSKSAQYVCACSGINLCPIHLESHAKLPGKHSIESLYMTLENKDLRILKTKLLAAINKINKAKLQITRETQSLIKFIQREYAKALDQLNKASQNYSAMFSKECFFRTQSNEIDKIIKCKLKIKPIYFRCKKYINAEYSQNLILEKVLSKSELRHKNLFEYGSYGFTCAAISIDERTLAIGSYDGSVKIWDLCNKKLKLILRGYEFRVDLLVLSNDSTYAISLSNDKQLIILSLKASSI